MAIDAHRFEGRLEAALSYALTLPVEEASARFEAIWESGAWRADPTRWLQRVNKMRDADRWMPARAGEVTLETLKALGWADAKPHVYNAFLLWADGTSELAERVAVWVSENADAGDADVVLRGAESFFEAFAGPAMKLVDWVLEHAISSLRSPHRVSLLRTLFMRLVELERHQDAALLLNLMLSLDRALQQWPSDLPLWRTVEITGLDQRLVIDLVHGLLRVGETHLAFQPLRARDIYQRTGQIVFEMIARCEIAPRFLERAWEVALEGPPPEDPEVLTSLVSLDAALAKLLWCERKVDRIPWARLFAEAYWRLWRDPSEDRDVLAVRAIRNLAAWRDDVAQGVAEALVERLRTRTDPSTELARDILADGPASVFRVVAALDCFAPMSTPKKPEKPTRPDDREVERLRLQLERFIGSPWPRSLYGLDIAAILKDIIRVELVELEGGDKVRLDGPVLKVARDYPDDLLRAGRHGDELLQAVFLYVAHELVHLPQGIGDIATVRRLRAVGAESNLLHVDLSADHIAALMVHSAVQRWSIVDLKAAILDSLAAFPSSPFHTDASRLRKSLRYVSERLDLLMRRASPQAVTSGYWFVDFGPLGGPAFVFTSGPPLRLIGEVALSKPDTEALLRASDGGEAAVAADRVVERIAQQVVR